MSRAWIALIVLPTALAACAGLSARQPSEVSAAALWTTLESQDYASTWSTWPGKGKMYPGTEPHGMLLTTYVNASALTAITGKKGAMPPGAVVVKENYTPQRRLAAVTVMWKVEGYNPSAGDWFWAKYAPGGKVLKEGKVAGCINCHAKAAANDYLFTGSLR